MYDRTSRIINNAILIHFTLYLYILFYPIMSSVTIFSGLSANSKRVYMRLAIWAVTTVGFSIQERRTMPSQELQRESLTAFTSVVDKCDLVILCQENFMTDVPLPGEITDIKRLLKDFYISTPDKVSRKHILFFNIDSY